MPILKFQEKWKADFPWVKESPLKLTAQCTWCNSSFSYDTMGRAALSSHAKGKRHQAMTANKQKSVPLTEFLQQPGPSSRPNTIQEKVPFQAVAPNDKCSDFASPSCSTVDKYMIKDSVTEAEILWCLNTVMTHTSLRSSEKCVTLFSKMFKDSNVAKEMKLHKDKISYSIVFGLAPYFTELLKVSLMGQDDKLYYVVGFDESFNKIAQRSQMDLSVRFWELSFNSVKSRYLGSVFLNQCKATDLMDAFKMGIRNLDPSKIIQISMDGPNVNWAFLKLIKNEFNDSLGPNAPKLLDLGTCGLHVVHGAFKTAISKTDWLTIQFLRALFNLFKMVPSRRGHFTEITGSKLFPLQFCTIRWVENSAVAARAIEMLPHLEVFVQKVKGTNNEPTSNSFKVVEKGLQDTLLPAKLAFFQSMADLLEPFLREFQSDSPKVPFLYDSLVMLLRDVMSRFVIKDEMMKKSFFKTDVFEKEDNLFKNLTRLKEMDLGYGTRSALKKCKNVKDKDILDFRKEVRTCYQYLVSKIQEKSPLKYPLTKAVSFLNPNAIARNESEAFNNLQNALDIMISSNLIVSSDAEKADREFRDIVAQPHFKIKAQQYTRNEERLDHFWASEITVATTLKKVVKTVLILSHGNATIERGFSVNKEILLENMREESLVAQRIIYDAVTDAGGLEKLSNNEIPRKMVHAMRNSYSKFKEAEESRRKNMTEKDIRAAEKRKRSFELKELEEEKKRTLERMKEELSFIDKKIKQIKS